VTGEAGEEKTGEQRLVKRNWWRVTGEERLVKRTGEE
jgi:hypothetical protein